MKIIYDLFMTSVATRNPIPFDCPAIYQINVRGRIDPNWSDRLEGMQISLIRLETELPITTLVGELFDQSSLAGVLNTLYELHLMVISVTCLKC